MSVRPSVGHTRVEFLKNLIFQLKWNKIALRTWNYTTWRTIQGTSTRADRQNASDVWTPSDFFLSFVSCFSFSEIYRFNYYFAARCFQYYSASCQSTYGVPLRGYVTTDNEKVALCTDEFSDISPLTNANVPFSTLESKRRKRDKRKMYEFQM